jgi:hypothetical protein
MGQLLRKDCPGAEAYRLHPTLADNFCLMSQVNGQHNVSMMSTSPLA